MTTQALDVLHAVNEALAPRVRTPEEEAAFHAKVEQMRDLIEQLPEGVRDPLVRAIQRAFDLQKDVQLAVLEAEYQISQRDFNKARDVLVHARHRQDEYFEVREWLAAHQASVEFDGLQEKYQQLLAIVDIAVVLREHGISATTEDFIESIGPENPELAERWAGIESECDQMLAERVGMVEGAETVVGPACDRARLLAYVRLVVAMGIMAEAAQRGETLRAPEDVQKLQDATRAYYLTHINPPDRADYAFGITDARARVIAGAAVVVTLTAGQFASWMADIDTYEAMLARHEYPLNDAQDVIGALGAVLKMTPYGQLREEIKARQNQVDREIARIRAILARYNRGPAHIEALEHQWLAYKVNRALLRVVGDASVTSLKKSTVEALAAAEAYCWAPVTVEAVGGVGREMPGECMLSDQALGDLAAPGKAGWWWFQDPIPIKTTDRSADVDPVAALLWRRELDADGLPCVWLQPMVLQVMELDGRPQAVCVPSAAFLWYDGTTLARLPEILRAKYDGIVTAAGKQAQRIHYVHDGEDREANLEAASREETVDACLWFARFFLAAATWLRQRIVVQADGGQFIRQASKRIQREYKLAERPRVRVIELRRAEQQMVQHTRSAEGAAGEKRTYSCRFVVGGLFGFTRNQWYASKQTHIPIWIAPFWKGDPNAPVRTGQSVYVVRR